MSCVWLALDGDELVMMHSAEHTKVRNLRRDPRVVVSMESQRLLKVALIRRSVYTWWSTARRELSKEVLRLWLP